VEGPGLRAAYPKLVPGTPKVGASSVEGVSGEYGYSKPEKPGIWDESG
jgi:hypothetical protein